MSNETMTDARALDEFAQDLRHLIVCDTQFGWSGDTTLKLPEIERLVARGWLAEGDENAEYDVTEEGRAIIAARLRGEAAPEGQAVARSLYDFEDDPQPAAVAGDAVRRIADEIDPRTDPSPRPWREIADELRSLSAAPAAPAPVSDLSCCGGNDETPREHCMDCSRYPGMVAEAPAPVAGDVPRSLVEQAREQLIRMGWSVDVGADAEAVFRRLLVAIRKALAQDRASQAGAAGVPEGWRLVPEKPTEAMLDRGWEYGERIDNCYDREGAYADLLAAAPKPAADGEVRNG